MLKGSEQSLVRPNERISVFRVKGLKTLGRVGTHNFFLLLFFHIKYTRPKKKRCI